MAGQTYSGRKGDVTMNEKLAVCVLAATVLLTGRTAPADSVELVNGDLLHGKVVSLDDRELRLVSDIHGAVIITRDKVAAIGLGDRKPARPPAAAESPDDAPEAQAVVRRSVPLGGRPAASTTVPVSPGSVQEVVRQLRSQGLTIDNINELQKAFPQLKEQPGVRKYFDEKVEGLIKGDINVEDIRKDAIRVREELRKTAKSLGPDGEKTLNQALGGYIQILDKFIKEAEPPASERKTVPADASSKKEQQDSAKKEPPSVSPQEADKAESRR
jgi:hypothetical protein